MANVVLHPWPDVLTDLHLHYTQAVSSTPGLISSTPGLYLAGFWYEPMPTQSEVVLTFPGVM